VKRVPVQALRAQSVVAVGVLMAACAGSVSLAQTEEEVTGMIQWEPGLRAFQALTTAVDGAGKAAGELGLGLVARASILGSDIPADSETGIVLALDAGTQYAFVGAADEATPGLRVSVWSVTDGKVGEELKGEDAEPGAAAATAFTPEAKGDYAVFLTPSGKAGPAFCAVLLLEKGGSDLVPQRIGDACGRLVATCQGTKEAALDWQATKGEWCLFGGLVAPGDEVYLGVDLEEGDYAFIAAGEASVTNADLSLTDKDDRPLVEDTEDDAYPVVVGKGPLSDGWINAKCVATQDGAAAFLVCAKLRVR